MPRYLIERTFPDRFTVPKTDEGAQTCRVIVSNNDLEGVTWVHSYVTTDKKKLFCIYDAPSPEAIRDAADHDNMPVDSIVQVNVLDPYFYQ